MSLLSEERDLLERKAKNVAAIEETLKLFPNLAEADLGDFFIECTAFPFAPIHECLGQIRDLATRSGGDWHKAVKLSMDDIDQAMADLKHE